MSVRKCLKYFVVAFFVSILFYSTLNREALASVQCYDCHGTRVSGDNRPEDASHRNISSGGFQGNHQKHLGPGATSNSCQKCHPGSSSYLSSHRDGTIKLSGNINASVHPSKARYINSTSSGYINYTSFPQTSDKTGRFFLGSCSNVNCHFESSTPVWGTGAFTAPDDCNRCHGTPPSGGETGAVGSHSRHNDYYNGANQCIKCHANHASFEHATSAGRRNLIVEPKDPLNTPGGGYSGAVDDYLPSQTNSFGSCSDLYCHSNAAPFDKANATATPVWGSGPQACVSCHDTGGSTSGLSGRHAKHTGATYQFKCDRCHTGTVTGNSTLISTALHVNKSKDVAFDSGGSYTGDKTCNSIYCHSDATGGAPGRTVKWSDTTVTMTCYSCHKGRAIDIDNTELNCGAIGGNWSSAKGYCTPDLAMSSNGHARLAGSRWVRKYACSNCHSDTITPMENLSTGKISDGAMIPSMHVNSVKNINVPAKWSMANEGKFFAYSSSTKTCYNVYCHSDGTHDAESVTTPYSWTQGRTSCNSCHGHPVGTCQDCHDGVKKFLVNNTPTVLTVNPSWELGEEWREAMPMYQNAGPGKARANSHPKHVSRNFTCDVCHRETVTNGNCLSCHNDFSNLNPMSEVAHINPDKHVNSKKDVAFQALSTTFTPPSYNDNKSCSNTPVSGCHGGTQDPTWGGSVNANSVVCVGCHSGETDMDMPFRGYTQARFNYNQWASTGHGRTKTSGPYPISNNPPANFVTNPCMYCHDSTLGKADHPVRGYSDSKNPYRLRVHSQFEKRFDKECAYCHMTGTTNSECMSCHNTSESLAPQLKNMSSVRLVTWPNRTTTVWRPDHTVYKNYSPDGTTCLTGLGCHNGDAQTHNTGPDTLGSWTADMKADVKNQYVQMGVCLQCHDDDSNDKCNQCHTAPANDPDRYALGLKVDTIFIKPSSARATSAHFGKMHYKDFQKTGGWSKVKASIKSPVFGTYTTYSGTWNGGKFCWNCHDAHGDSNIYMVHDEVSTTTDATYGLPLTRAKVVFTKKEFGTDYITYTNNAYTGICNVCHTDAKHHKKGSSDSHNTGRICTTCHEHRFSDSHAGKNASGIKNPCNQCHQSKPVPRHSAFGLPRDCTKCHAGTILNRMDVMRQFRSNSHHVQGVEISNQQCYQCHWESTQLGLIDNTYHVGFNYKNYSTVIGAEVDLVLYGPGYRPTFYSSTSAVRFLARNIGTVNERAEAAKVSNHCLSCHNDQNNNTTPFQDCRVPRQYAWDNQSIAARYSQMGTTAWGKYGTNGKSSVVKSFSAHGNAPANQGGWDKDSGYDGTNSIPNTRNGAVSVQCYDCHSSHGSNVVGTTTSYTTFNGTNNGGNLKETQAGKGGYSMSYTASKNTTPGAVNPYNPGAGQCFDCHMTQAANSTTPPTPWGYVSTFGASKPIKSYRDGYKFGGRSDQNGFPNDTFKLTSNPMKKEKNDIISGHLRSSSDVNLNSPVVPENKISGLCTPCHDPHGVSPTLGSNQQYAVPLLKGTWMTSPYKDDQPPPLPIEYETRNIAGRNFGPSDHSWGSSWDRDAWPTGISSHYNNSPNPALGEPFTRFFLDRNTFGVGSFAKENDQAFAGLCLRCHAQDKLIMKNISTPAWKSPDRIHRTVKGWGKNTEHAFTCSKCHQPHNSALPRLMQTNCLDYNHRGSVASGGKPWRAASEPGRGDYNSISADEHRGYPEGNLMGRYLDADKACHVNAKGVTGTNWSGSTPPSLQYWNNVTPW